MRGFGGRKQRESCVTVLSSQKIKNNKNSQDIKKEALATCSLMRLLVREHDIFEFNKCKPFTDFEFNECVLTLFEKFR